MALCKYALPDNQLKNGRKIIAISGASDVWQIECNHNWTSNQLHFQDPKLCGMQFVPLPPYKQLACISNIAPKVFVHYLIEAAQLTGWFYCFHLVSVIILICCPAYVQICYFILLFICLLKMFRFVAEQTITVAAPSGGPCVLGGMSILISLDNYLDLLLCKRLDLSSPNV